ncbi:MAG: glycosyltransferase family 39 protein [Saprospiraceae bacterium]
MKRIWTYLSSAKFLIALFFLIGLENILLPPFDNHGWRQTLTLSIAENFLDYPNIFYPRMDIGNETEGIIACEFPILNYLITICFKIFGVNFWSGRLVNWTVTCIGLWFFYDLVKKTLNPRAALFALLAIMGSIVMEYARKSMPDTFALSLSVAGAWFLWNYLENQSRKYLLIGFFLTTLGILSKIPFLVMLTFLVIPFLDKQIDLKAKRIVTVTLGLTMACVGWWYFYWMPFLIQQYGNQLIWPVSFEEGWRIVIEQHASESWHSLVHSPFQYKIPFLISIMGMGLVLTGENSKLKWFTLLYVLLYFAFALKTGIVFPTHEYYIIPLVPLLALFFGHFFDRLQWKQVYSVSLVILLLAPSYIYNKKRSFSPVPNRAYLMTLSDIMDKYTKPTDKIMVNDGSYSPTLMYWAKRKGWTVNQDVPAKSTWMPAFQKQGLKYILMDRHSSDEALPYKLLYEDEHFRLYEL